MAARDVALAPPGASRAETRKMVMNGEGKSTPRVTKNCAALLGLFARMFGGGLGAHAAASSPRITRRSPVPVGTAVVYQ